MIPQNFRMTNSTMLERKHKSEYMKAGKKEIVFTKYIKNMKTCNYDFDEKSGSTVSKELQKEAYVTAPELAKKRKELKEHQKINRIKKSKSKKVSK